MKVVPKELLTSVRIEGAEHITQEHLFFWLLVGGNIGLLPKSPPTGLPYHQGVRWGGPAHRPLLHRGFMSPGLGVCHLCMHREEELGQQNTAIPRPVIQWEDLQKCRTSTSEQRPELSSSVFHTCRETTMLLLLFPAQRAKNFQNLQQWPSSAALEANARTSDICLRALENPICCWSCCRAALCISLPISSSIPSLCPCLRKSWPALLL